MKPTCAPVEGVGLNHFHALAGAGWRLAKRSLTGVMIEPL
jgi:hypothetical protein